MEEKLLGNTLVKAKVTIEILNPIGKDNIKEEYATTASAFSNDTEMLDRQLKYAKESCIKNLISMLGEELRNENFNTIKRIYKGRAL